MSNDYKNTSYELWFPDSCPWCGEEFQVSDYAGTCSECGRDWVVRVEGTVDGTVIQREICPHFKGKPCQHCGKPTAGLDGRSKLCSECRANGIKQA